MENEKSIYIYTVYIYIHIQTAGSGMERVGVSNSLLGTYDQH